MLLAAGALVALGCAAQKPPPPPPSPPPLAETPLPPTGSAEFEIGPIRHTATDDDRSLIVEGTVRNRGSRASRGVRVWVSGLDANGLRVARSEVLPTPQEIPPGTAATFVARLPNDPAIRTFHVEAIGK